jgi:hypothetical protein
MITSTMTAGGGDDRISEDCRRRRWPHPRPRRIIREECRRPRRRRRAWPLGRGASARLDSCSKRRGARIQKGVAPGPEGGGAPCASTGAPSSHSKRRAAHSKRRASPAFKKARVSLALKVTQIGARGRRGTCSRRRGASARIDWCSKRRGARIQKGVAPGPAGGSPPCASPPASPRARPAAAAARAGPAATDAHPAHQ